MNLILRTLKDYLKSEKKIKYYFLIFFWVIVSWVWIIEPFFMKEIIWWIEKYIKTNDFNLIFFIKIFSYWAIFIILITISRAIYLFWINKLLLKGHAQIYKKQAEKLINISYNSYLNKKQGEIYKIFDRGMEWSFFFLDQLLTKFLDVFVSLVLILSVLIYINFYMAIATIAMVPVMIFIWLYINKKTLNIQKKVNDKRDNAYWELSDSLTNLWLVKTLTLEKIIQKSINKKIDYANSNQLLVTKRWVVSDIYTSILVMISRFLVLSLWIYLLINNRLDFATLFLFFSFIWYIYFPLSFIFNSLKNIQKQLTWIEKFYKLFDELNYDKDSWNKKIEDIKWKIELKNINFWYNKKKQILKNINLKINPWEKIALVWNTWAGKSTIVNLLFRFWDVDSWEILIDWENIKEISKESLRKNIGLVMQDNSLFNTSIKENLLFAKQNATKEELDTAIKLAQADFVYDLKDWLDTIIWERWLKLSWGEKQRLSIARLFLKNPKILVLDEATSALDNKTEKLIQKALDNLMKGRTSIIIAHRLSTIQNATKIYMLENWKIIEEWKYDELMNRKTKFYQLANPEHLILN